MDDKVLNHFTVSQFLGKNRILDQILLLEPFFGQLAWEWPKKRFPTLIKEMLHKTIRNDDLSVTQR